ncbi:MAG: hypothetical protein ABC585_04425 [Candidatus Methanosuratincola petrocarbonis]|nr:hypothetical protein [Candidatus Methanosuratincola sp.]
MESQRLLVTLAPPEAKRLIGRGVSKLPQVRHALSEGTVVIAPGTTNAYVYEEITGERIDRGRFAIGIVTRRGTCVAKASARMPEIVLSRGLKTGQRIKDVLDALGPQDVFIKGANAVDPWGNAGVYLGSPTGGTMGMSIGTLLARGVQVVVPVSLEKLVPFQISEIIPEMGNRRFAAAMQMPVGMMQVPGKVVTEMEAARILFGCRCIPVGGGGVNGAEGGRCYVLEGDAGSLGEAWEYLRSIKGEPPVQVEEESCYECKMSCSLNITPLSY